MNRAIVITERADEHLVWHEHRIFIKPMPAFLLCHSFWETHLCSDRDLHASACGSKLPTESRVISYHQPGQYDLDTPREAHTVSNFA